MVSYENLHLDEGEHVLIEVRKHWFLFAIQAFGLLIGGFAPFIFLTAVNVFIPELVHSILLPGNTSALFLFFYSLWLLFLWISFFVEWTKYYLDVWYVTEKRIIDVQQKRIFDREISNIRFDKVEDITVEIAGFLSTYLDFGTIKVQTAGEIDSDFTMTMVRNPNQVRDIIFNQHNEIGDVPIKPTTHTS
ncbi:MAG: PH domain-containing protein [Patescibacteria group bacterium]